MCTEFFLSLLKAQREKRGGRILLDDNPVGGTVMMGPIRLQCAGIWISARPPLYLHTIYRVYNQFQTASDISEHKYCLNRAVSVQGHRKRWTGFETAIT